jgi:hypothetical protein
MTAVLYPALRSDRPLLVRTACAGVFVTVAFVVTVALPLATYTTALALFGLAHVLSELTYVDRRFGARLGAGKALRIGLPILVAVMARAAATLGLLAPAVGVAIELLAAAALALGVVTRMRRCRVAGAAIGLFLAGGAVAAPFQMLLGLALLHNLTPLGFFAEALAGERRRRALILLAVPLVALPLLIATGLPSAVLARLGLVLPEARILASGPLAINLGAFVPASLVPTDWALHAFSAAVFAQIMHYAAVIVLLPRLSEEMPAGRVPRWSAQHWVKPAIAVAAAGFALVFVVDYGFARQLYALAALVHSWVEIRGLLLALGGAAMAQSATA